MGEAEVGRGERSGGWGGGRGWKGREREAEVGVGEAEVGRGERGGDSPGTSGPYCLSSIRSECSLGLSMAWQLNRSPENQGNATVSIRKNNLSLAAFVISVFFKDYRQ